MEPPIVISVGGSLIVPNGGIDTNFLIKLNHLIREEVAKGKRFLLIAGGGKLCRHYQEAGKAVIGNLTRAECMEMMEYLDKTYDKQLL